jgi:hypothetical protein
MDRSLAELTGTGLTAGLGLECGTAGARDVVRNDRDQRIPGGAAR